MWPVELVGRLAKLMVGQLGGGLVAICCSQPVVLLGCCRLWLVSWLRCWLVG